MNSRFRCAVNAPVQDAHSPKIEPMLRTMPPGLISGSNARVSNAGISTVDLLANILKRVRLN